MDTQSGIAADRPFPLRELLYAQVKRVLAMCESTGGAEGRASRRALRRFLDALQDLVTAGEALASPQTVAAPRSEILCVGTEHALSASLEAWLDPAYRLEHVGGTEIAVRVATEGAPDIVLAGDSGIAALEALRRLHPGLPAVVVSSSTDQTALLTRFADDPVVVLRAPAEPREVAMALRAVLDAAALRPRALARSGEDSEARSYAHLAGLLPRALERAVDFDAAASVISRPGQEPAVDIHAASDVTPDALEVVRLRALALFRLLTVGTGSREDVAVLAAPSPFQSSLHVPLATRGGIVGMTYLVSFRPDAFSELDRRSLVDLATHAAGAYRRLDGNIRRLRVTPRQAQILSLIAAGLSDAAVAERLGVAHRTVRTHLDRLLREHGLHSRTEAVSAWLRGQQQ